MNELLGHHIETEATNGATPILVSGLPGNMATLTAEALSQDARFNLLPFATTSERQRNTSQRLNNGRRVNLLNYYPLDLPEGTIAIDFTTPQSAEINAINYTQRRIPFVMGTTGGNRDAIEEMVRNSEISAVIAPNMNMDVISRQIEIDQIAEFDPDFFRGSSVHIRESHQKTKRDISGTALAFKAQFERHGAEVAPIESIRDTEAQLSLGIPNPDAGHGYHWIWVTNPNGEHIYRFETKINGRESYVDGTLAAAEFLHRRMQEGARGQVFTMRDVVQDLRRAA
ncbi:MAG: Dihydrodipicolinate reductase [Candidatus Curtissbacteria bacterium GW2011_GWA1_40_16]|uniref:4-hydroxy-tetrahydrodipicolinate reductase n=1 Tax=Candidatus Curtissbacteria bacterium GW2011_GWA1_40_16 TaxID=1618405 RepID=A0A0G0UJS1_9BACT|nr:MAG: Dihydrodipicolinate reductase [Candidatus Curtissbacteria bacterium GW2011_GWA1_40_16]